jgi:hypothetical protein
VAVIHTCSNVANYFVDNDNDNDDDDDRRRRRI